MARPGGNGSKGRAPFRRGGRRGVAALEFGLVAPVLMITVAGIVDIGNALVAKYILDASVTASAGFAMVSYDKVNATDAAALATKLGNIAANARKNAWADSVATVNNGPVSTVTAGAAVASGTAANADNCYCPTGSAATTVTWGSPVTCGNACAGGGTAGKFVLISASHTYTPIFSGYSFLPSGKMTVAALVQVK